MSKIRMIGLDLDGTLLNAKKTVSKRTKQVLEHVIAKGVIVLVATGRPYCGVPKELLEFPGIQYALTVNGGRIVAIPEERVIYESLLSKKRAGQILDILDKYDTAQEIYYDGIGYAQQNKLDKIEHYIEDKNMAVYIRNTRQGVRDIRGKLEQEERNLDKVQGVFRHLEERSLAWKELEDIPDIAVTGALKNNIEINNYGVNKGAGMLWLGELLGIKKEQIMACGDGLNDLEMIEQVGFGVAMSNGCKEVRDIADYITQTNDEEGVANAIERFVLCD